MKRSTEDASDEPGPHRELDRRFAEMGARYFAYPVENVIHDEGAFVDNVKNV